MIAHEAPECWFGPFAAISRLRDALEIAGSCVVNVADFRLLTPESYPTATFNEFAHACIEDGLPWPDMPRRFVTGINDLAARLGATVEWPTRMVRRGSCVERIRADEVLFRRL